MIRKLILCSLLFPAMVLPSDGANGLLRRDRLKSKIENRFPEQLTNPQKKKRKAMSQFGYNLSYFQIPTLPITNFIRPGKFGIHSYGQSSRKEHNGCIYTHRGGFIDFTHLRAGLDWTVYLTFKILVENQDFELTPESGKLKLQFQNLEDLTLDDIASLAQKIAFERLTWHEIASWHYHSPNHRIPENQSAFTPEDTYSNFLGCVIGKNVALRMLSGMETSTYSEIASEEIESMLQRLEPVATKQDSKRAYDLVDRNKQMMLPESERNADIWWDSGIIFRDQRYVFKRYMDIGPELKPWLVPDSRVLGAVSNPLPEILQVPERTRAGASLHKYYEFSIEPDQELFYAKHSGKELHAPFGKFTTRSLDHVMDFLSAEMEKILLPGFDVRNQIDPLPLYGNIRRVSHPRDLFSGLTGKKRSDSPQQGMTAKAAEE